MPITRHHTGRWLYQLRRTVAGKRLRLNKLLPQGWTKAEAERFDLEETGRQIALATGVRPRQHLIEHAVLLYLQQHAPDLKNRTDIIGALSLLQPFYAGKAMEQLPEVAEVYAKKARGEDGQPIKPATIRNRLAYLRAACRWAWKVHKMGEHDPAERMILPKVKNARHVYLSRAQAVAVFRAMGMSWARDAARVAFYTGWRISEVLQATPIETPSGLSLSIPDTKNGLPRMVPVHDKILHLVRRHWPPQVTKWTVSKEVKAALREVGLGHARLHDLRHSAASEMINSGIDLYTVGGVLGHKSSVSTARYAHLAQDRLREAVAKIGGRKLQPGGKKKAA